MIAPTFGDPRLPARFWVKVTLGCAPEARPELGPCWLWGASIRPDGYGEFRTHRVEETQGRRVTALAHRRAYLVLVGETPLGLDHLCRVRGCVNPGHLEPVTSGENSRRSPVVVSTINAAKTHCPQGHPYNETNTMRDASGARRCRACRNAYERATRRHRAVVKESA